MAFSVSSRGCFWCCAGLLQADGLVKVTDPPGLGRCQVSLRCHLDSSKGEISDPLPSRAITTIPSSTAQPEQSRCSFMKWHQNMVRKRLQDLELKCAQGHKTYHVNTDILTFRSICS